MRGVQGLATGDNIDLGREVSVDATHRQTQGKLPHPLGRLLKDKVSHDDPEHS